jgi:predicted membrane channel-forming protein YqfA (hemolysin III family)
MSLAIWSWSAKADSIDIGGTGAAESSVESLSRTMEGMMRSRAWAWLVALVALVLAVIPMAAMAGIFGRPMSVAMANAFWLAAIALTIVSFGMSLRQGLRTRTRTRL